MWMWHIFDSVGNRVSHRGIRVLHIELESKHSFSFVIFSQSHCLELSQVFFNGSVSPWTLKSSASIIRHFLLSLMADVSVSLFDQLNGEFVEIVKVLRGMSDLEGLVSQPVNILLDTVNVFHTFSLWVSIVETQVGLASVFGSKQEIESHSEGMSDMNIAVWFWRETSVNLSAGGF